MGDNQGILQLTRMKNLCGRIFQNPSDFEAIAELQNVINGSSPTVVKVIQHIIYPVFVPYLQRISESKNCFKEKEKQQIVDTFRALFDKTAVEKLPLFFNIYGFLLFEIYDHKNHGILNISEEYKLSIVECMTSLTNSLNEDVIKELYVKENAPKLCQMMYVLLELAKNEEFKTLRISSINCIMSLGRVLNDDDFNDVVLRNQVADVFLFFLPGVATNLLNVAVIDEKFGHKIPTVALKAWGRLVTLLMQDYNAEDQKLKINKTTERHIKHKFKTEEEVQEYIEHGKRTPEWYQENDDNLKKIVLQFAILTHHSHSNVRLELVTMCTLLVQNCLNTMPSSILHLIDIVIILSEDDVSSVRQHSRTLLDKLSKQLSDTEFQSLFESLEENFFGVLSTIPRKFNGIDEKVQIVALNAVIGYLRLFGKHNLTRLLLSNIHLNKLLLTLLHISEFDTKDFSILEEYTNPDYDLDQNLRPMWKKFNYFKDPTILAKIQTICHLLSQEGGASTISYFLLDAIQTNSEQRKAAIFLLNEIIAGTIPNEANLYIFKNMIKCYIDPEFWYLPLTVGIDEFGYEHTLSDVQSNVLQICLLTEGIGKNALSLGTQFQQFILRTLYLVLERAGSAHPFIRTSGVLALSQISKACEFASITELINENIDYFSFHIERQLNRGNSLTGGLDVLAVVIKYSTKEVLNSTCETVHELLLRTHEHRTNLNSYLHVFKMFILGLHKWLDITVEHVFKTKKQKEEEYEDFQVSDIKPDDFSDDIMGKSAEEMYAEDLAKSQTELDEEMEDLTEYKKPEAPTQIKLVVKILNRSLNYLPSKDKGRKLLVLEILRNGLPVLRDFEDELLPIVHQIWGPLVDRFKEVQAPVIVNYSFQLLVMMAVLSKDFIRSRTSKDVLPNILSILETLGQESYLKDTGSAYRYSQNYKLQIAIMENLGNVITDLDMLQSDFDKSMEVIFKYLSNRQPLPLQKLAIVFFETLLKYDLEANNTRFQKLVQNTTSTEFENNVTKIGLYK